MIAVSVAQAEQQDGASSVAGEGTSEIGAARIPRVTSAGTRRGEMLYRQLGNTGEQVSVIGMGGSHLGLPTVDEALAIRLVHEGLDRGINFLDNSWDYNEGRSEERVGKALSQAGYRQKAFVMTKIDGRTKEVAANQIETSLKRLKVDHIDLLQHHEVLRYDDPDRIFNEGGSMEAVVAARQAGRSVLSDSRITKIRTFTFTYWTLRKNAAFTSILCRCLSTLWMLTSAASRGW
jgi:aryl-alcohol dehydrogenase-like predicted oxidoreductase